MSSIARWTYTNQATIRPFLSLNQLTGATEYGQEYKIKCTWEASSKMERESGGQGGARGAEFVSQHIIYTEDLRPKYLDEISFNGSNGFEQIRSATQWDMSPFADTPDRKLVT